MKYTSCYNFFGRGGYPRPRVSAVRLTAYWETNQYTKFNKNQAINLVNITIFVRKDTFLLFFLSLKNELKFIFLKPFTV